MEQGGKSRHTTISAARANTRGHLLSRFQVAWLCALLVTIIGYFTYFQGYSQPKFFFWDENYHVAHAQKYLHGIFFMEPHPPLGKLLIALGEFLLEPNPESNQFIGTDHAKHTPDGFSFAGYRFIPSLLSWLTAPLIFGVFLLILGRPLWALLLSSLYLFDNALIVHGRGAMLESTQLFFVVLMLFASLSLLKPRKHSARTLIVLSGIVGAAFAAAMVTKVNALILIVLGPLLLWRFRKKVRQLTLVAGVSLFSALLVYALVWQVHFSLARTVDSRLPNNGWYQASPQYKQILDKGTVFSPRSFFVMLGDSFGFVSHYQKGVPKLNLCNHNENGSPALLWPLGGRTINYRWERNDGLTSYLYLVPNPIGWLLSLLSVISAIGLLLAQGLLPLRFRLRNPSLLAGFVTMYLGYMGVMAALPRVMYLYHYFIPLLLGFVLCALVIREIRVWPARSLSRSGGKQTSRLGQLVQLVPNSRASVSLSVMAALVVATFSYFSPFTYSRPLSDTEVGNRAWLRLWDLRPAGAEPANGIARPLCDPKVKDFPSVEISGIKAAKGFQDWGDPKQNLTVDQRPIVVKGVTYASGVGVHSTSSLDFHLQKRFGRFIGKVGLPDYLREKTGVQGSVEFQVLGDGKLLWSSGVLRGPGALASFDVVLSDVSVVQLSVRDGGDGIDSDHAVWIEPMFLP